MTREEVLTVLFDATDQAGLGFADGLTFEAIPGLEIAAADYMLAMLEVLDSVEGGEHE